MQNRRLLLNNDEFNIILDRLAFQLIENHNDFEDTVIIGLQKGGAYLVDVLGGILDKLCPNAINRGYLDITFFRDDLNRKIENIVPSHTEIDFSIDNKNVILVDDVLYTGRSVRAALSTLHSMGRSKKIELLVLINRRFSRKLPISPNYVGKSVDVIESEKVEVCFNGKDNKNGVFLVDY